MTTICKTVTLRSRKIKNGTQLSFYLDYYPGYRDEETMKTIRHESLGIYIYAKPKNQREREYNETMTEKAEAIRCKRFESIVNERFDFFDKERQKGDFLEYIRKKSARRDDNRYEQVHKHFSDFCKGRCTFGEITVELCQRFREHLLTTNSTKSTKHPKPLSRNTAALYWSSFRGLLHIAYKEHKITENPNGFLEKIEKLPTDKESLSVQEVYTLAETECDVPVLKMAFLFACLTGLRKSDVRRLTWRMFQLYGNGGIFVKIRMQKTGQFINNPISEEALNLIGYYDNAEGRNPDELVFPSLNETMTKEPLKKWIASAGITKHITFHCSRHTFGTLQVEAGTAIYVVQKMLGHKNVSTTEIYAQMGDSQKRASVDRISLKPKTQQQLRIVGGTNAPTADTIDNNDTLKKFNNKNTDTMNYIRNNNEQFTFPHNDGAMNK